MALTARLDDFLEDRLDKLRAAITRRWWAVGLRGLVALIFGVSALFMPAAAMLSLVFVFAVYAIIDGAFAIISGARGHGENWGEMLLFGGVGVALGVAALVWPHITVLAFVLLIAAWAIVSGVLGLIGANRLHQKQGRGWLIGGSIASLVFGVLLAIAPIAGALVLTWWIGSWFVIYGLLLIVLALRLRSHRPAKA